MNRVKVALTRKLGPLPAWAWLTLFAIAVIIYRARANNGINPVNVTDTTPADGTAPPAPGDPVVLQPGESVYDPGTGAVSGGAPEQITPPQPTAPPDPVVLDPGQGVYDPGSGQFITNPGTTDTGEDTGDTPGSSSAAAKGVKPPKTTKIEKVKGSGEKRQWRYNGHWHSVPPKDAINERRSIKGKSGKREVQYWWGNHWHSKPMPKSKQTMAGASKPTTRTGGAPRAGRMNTGAPIRPPAGGPSRLRSPVGTMQTLTKAGGVGTGTPPGRPRDNSAPGQSRGRSLPLKQQQTVMIARPLSPMADLPHPSATPPPPVPPMVITPPVSRVVSKPQPPRTTSKSTRMR